MLITRGFGTGTGEGPGENIYVPITDLKTSTIVVGKNIVTSSENLPNFVSGEESVESIPKIHSRQIDTDIDIEHLKPKITTNIPKS